jgi:hypothetical protein
MSYVHLLGMWDGFLTVLAAVFLSEKEGSSERRLSLLRNPTQLYDCEYCHQINSDWILHTLSLKLSVPFFRLSSLCFLIVNAWRVVCSCLGTGCFRPLRCSRWQRLFACCAAAAAVACGLSGDWRCRESVFFGFLSPTVFLCVGG